MYTHLKTKGPRTVYLDLDHHLFLPWESNPDAQGVDVIYCKIAGRQAWRMNQEFDDESSYCSECIELFDPEDVCPRVTVKDQVDGVKVVTLVR